MVKKAKTKTCKKLKAQIQEKRQMFLRKLQQVRKKVSGKSSNSNDSDRVFHTKDMRDSFSERDSHTNVCNENPTRDDYTCYRCKHFLKIPYNLSQPFNDSVSIFVEQCQNALSFIQAIAWLKSSIACVPQIPVKQLEQIFHEQWSIRDKHNQHDDELSDVEQLRPSLDNDLQDLLTYEGISTRDSIVTSTPLNTSFFDVPHVTPQRKIWGSYTKCKDPNSVLANDPNESIELSILHSNSSSHYIVAKEKEKEVKLIPGTDVESSGNEDLDIIDNISDEYQSSFKQEGGNKICSVQSTSENGIEHIFQKNVPNEHEYTLSRNQSVDSMFEHNSSRERLISIRSQNNLINKEFNGSLKSFIITPKNVSQMSNVRKEYFDFLLDDNSPWETSNMIADKNSDEDSAYSTSRIFNCDIAGEAGSVTGNDSVLNTEYYHKLQPCETNTITLHEKENVSFSTNEMLPFNDGPRNTIVTEKGISQISNDVYNVENPEFQISCDERMSKNSSENSDDDVAMATETNVSNNGTENIKHCYNEKTAVSHSSFSIIQRGVIPRTNIQHHYNLRASNDRKISREKESSSSIIRGPQKRKSGRASNLSEETNEDEMISVNWLNCTVESLRIERVILASIKVILSTLCDKRMVKEYVIRHQRRNMRNYWKGSLEEKAITAVLNMSDIFTIEEKPNICIKIIVMAIIQTLNEMMREQVFKIYCTQTSVWIYHVQIILEFCNSLPICIKVTNYLITKLKLFLLTNIRNIQEYNCVKIKQLHLVFYALNITLRKYCTIISRDQGSRLAEKVIPHVVDLWKIRYIDKELEHTHLDLNAAEKQWLNTLENTAVAFADFGFIKFAEKSFSLINMLISPI